MVIDKSFIKLNEHDLIRLAIDCKDYNLLEKLADSIYVTVRRCVAKNKNITSRIANRLALDPALNVSYWALRNNKCTSKKMMIESDDNCVICTVNELDYINTCNSCRNSR